MGKSTKTTRITDRIFHDKTGSYVIGQPPNIPVILAAVALAGSYLAPRDSTLDQLFGLIAFGSIFLWAYLEIMYGESLFRRGLGAFVLVTVFVVVLR